MKQNIVANGIHNYTPPEEYIPPRSPEVQKHLEWFMELKLGFMMHWAPGCQLGTYESWPLSDGDAAWSQEDFTWAPREECKQQYWDANKTFNPVKFDAASWAELAKECGFQYLLFTTKHHDGFCMYDTKTTDYKITSPDCPFHTHRDADIVGALYREFRSRGMAISTYFSKPDWHSPYYWAPQFGTAPTRNVNYDVSEHPELWEQYVQFVHEQIRELCSNYGKIDVLWLDGGWVRPDNLGQDIRLGEIVEEIRSTTQPHLIVCERTCGGEYENFITPEKTVPETALQVPWETCTTIGEKFSFHYTDTFKSGRELVHLLLEVVSKGGNLALNLAPQPDGLLPERAVRSLRDLGAWIKLFGDGIYGTHIVSPYFENRLFYTQKDNRVFAFHTYEEIPSLPAKLTVHCPFPVTQVQSMRTGQTIKFRQNGDSVVLDVSGLAMGGAFYAEGFVLSVSPQA